MLDIHTKNITLSEKQKELVHQKIEKLFNFWERLRDESTKVRVEIDHDPIREKHKRIFCAVTIFAPKVKLRADLHEKTVRNALDEVEKKLRSQIEKEKTKKG